MCDLSQIVCFLLHVILCGISYSFSSVTKCYRFHNNMFHLNRINVFRFYRIKYLYYLCVNQNHLYRLEFMKDTNAEFSLIAEYYSQHYEELKAFVAKRLLYSETAEDIVQNVFLKLMSIDSMVTPVTLPSLVYTTARNLIYDYWRHRKYVDEYEHYVKHSGGMFAGVSSETPMSVYSVNEINEILEHGIISLSEHQQKIYRLNIYSGMKVSEISKTLDMNYKSVEHRLGSARKEVREYIRKALA